MSMREQVLMRRLGIRNSAVARSAIAGNDTAHDRTMKKLFGVDWMDASPYAIVLNTARVPVRECVEVIARLATSGTFQETPEARAVLMDELILSRVRAALEQRFPGAAGADCVEATVT